MSECCATEEDSERDGTKMMTESVTNSHHNNMNSNTGSSNPKGFDPQTLLDKNSGGGGGDDLGWKAKLKIPPKDNRIKTSVSYKPTTISLKKHF